MLSPTRQLFNCATEAWAIANTVEKSLAQWDAELRRPNKPYPLVSPEASELGRRLDTLAAGLATPTQLREFAAACETRTAAWEAKAPSTAGLYDRELAYTKAMTNHYRGCARVERGRARVFRAAMESRK